LSREFSVVLILVLLPSLLLTVAVCGLLYLSVKSFRRGQIVFSAVTLIAALSPFIQFVNSTVQSILADRERAKPLASLAKAGPVTSYPDVLVVRGGISKSHAARLMLAAGFREVDVIGMGPRDGTLAIAPIADCREALETVAAAERDGHYVGRYSPADDNLDRCLAITKWDQQPPERSSAVVLLQGKFTAFKQTAWRSLDRGLSTPPSYDLELRIKDGGKDVLVDYWQVLSDRPMFPLLVYANGHFLEQNPGMSHAGPSPVIFVLRNLQRREQG